MSGKLYIVPTPIGNLQDITLRALEVLRTVDQVLAEDTRTTGQLLKHFEIENTLRSFHMHNEHKAVHGVVEMLKEGKQVALVSDAGTPGISDPGFLLVRSCVEASIPVETLPGATAFVPALVQSGFPTDQFVYEGFLPHKKGRQTRIQRIATEDRTTVLYESPHRIVKLLQSLVECCDAERRVSVSREITKKFEEHIRGTVSDVLIHFQEHPPKGEFVVVVEGQGARKKDDSKEKSNAPFSV